MSSPPVRLDFAAPRMRTTFTGVALLVVGCAALVLAALEYRAVSARRAGLELKLSAAQRHAGHSPLDAARSVRLSEEAAAVARELSTPWTTMLADLESASGESQGRIAVLTVEPDHDKRRIRINAESRDLPGALAYLQRLQASRSLRYPMLDSHEVVTEDAEHPVRFALTADWRELP